MWEGAGQGRSSVGRSRRRRKCQPLLDGRRRQAYICRHYTEMTGLYIYGPIKKESRKICPSHGKRPELTDRGQGRRQLPWFVAREWHHVCRFSLNFFSREFASAAVALGLLHRNVLDVEFGKPSGWFTTFPLSAPSSCHWQPVAGSQSRAIIDATSSGSTASRTQNKVRPNGFWPPKFSSCQMERDLNLSGWCRRDPKVRW